MGVKITKILHIPTISVIFTKILISLGDIGIITFIIYGFRIKTNS